MRTCTAIVALILLASSVFADAEQETPRESFENFEAAVLDTDLDAQARKAVFVRYFDSASWLKARSAEEGKVFTEDEQADLLKQWFALFQSADFSQTWRRRNVRVLEELSPDRTAGTAELVIAMQASDGADEKFRVLMTLSEDGSHWRWYSIPQIEEPVQALTPEQKIERIEQALKLIADQRKELDAQDAALRTELARLRAALAETDAGKTPYATPISVVETAWRAIEKGDEDALLDCHTTRRVSESKLDELKTKLAKTRQRLMAWKVLDSTIDELDPYRASVRVKLTLQRTGEPDERTISVPVVRDGKEWKIDEAP